MIMLKELLKAIEKMRCDKRKFIAMSKTSSVEEMEKAGLTFSKTKTK